MDPSASIRRFRISLIGVCVSLAAVQAYTARNLMFPDGVSYLEVGTAFIRGDWSHAISGYWSPVFPWLLGILLWLTRAEGLRQFQVGHALQFFMFVLALVMFDRFWCAIIGTLPERPAARPLKISALYLGYAAFAFSFVPMVQEITPDLLLTAVVLGIALSFWKFTFEMQSRWLIAAGALLGFGYLVKAILLPVGLVTLLTAGAWIVIRRRSMTPVIWAGAALLLLASPLILVLSSRAGHFSTGDTGHLAYRWYASERHTQVSEFLPLGEVIGTNPRIYSTGIVANITFWPWFDPAALDTRQDASFNLRNQAVRLANNLEVYRQLVLLNGHAYLIMAILVIFSFHALTFRYTELLDCFPIFVFALSALGAYALVLVEGRYVNAFACVLLGTSLGLALRRLEEADFFFAGRVMVIAACLFTIQAVPTAAYRIATSDIQAKNETQIRVARTLQDNGVKPGDAVAVTDWPHFQYWPKLLNASVSAYVPVTITELSAFCRSGQGPSKETLDLLRSTGARWLVSSASSKDCGLDGWQVIPQTSFRFRKLE